MIALVRKELDAGGPFLIAALAVGFIHAADLLTEPLGHWDVWRIATDEMDFWGLLGALIGFSLAHSLAAQEFTEDHIQFLDGLPVSRTAVFAAKVIASLFPVFVMAGLTTGIRLVVLWAMAPPEALYGEAMQVQLVVTGRLLALSLGGMGIGLLFSWLRGLGWGLFGMLLTATIIPGFIYPPLKPYGWYQGFTLPHPALHGVDPAWGPVLAWLGAGALGALASWILFLGPGAWLVGARSSLAGAARWATAGCAGLVFLAISGLGFLAFSIQYLPRLMQDPDVKHHGELTFMYPADREADVLPVVRIGARANAFMADALESGGPLSIDIETMGASAAHAGVFTGGRIRMTLDSAPEDTLPHELAHAHAQKARGGRLGQFNSTRFFEEGLATFLESRFHDEWPDLRLAAAIWRDGHGTFHELVDDEARTELYDSDEVYPLGAVFVRALFEEGGMPGVACVNRSASRAADRDLSGMGLWYTALADCDLDLYVVLRRYDSLMHGAAQRLGPEVEVNATLGERHGLAVMEVEVPEGADVRVLCRFRGDENEQRVQHETVEIEDGHCLVPFTKSTAGRFEVQLGVTPDGQPELTPVFGEWVRVGH